MHYQHKLYWLHHRAASDNLGPLPGDWRLREFGRRVRALRLARGLTEGELGRPYSRAYVSLLEQGYISPTVRALSTVADRLGVSPVELVRVTARDVAANAPLPERDEVAHRPAVRPR